MSQINLSGFGDDNANGYYDEVGIHDSYPYYEKTTNDYVIIYKDEYGPYSFYPAYYIIKVNQLYGSVPTFSPKYVSFDTDVETAEWSPMTDSTSGESEVGFIDVNLSSSSSSSSDGYSSSSSSDGNSESSSSSSEVWTPREITTLAWYDASDINSITESSSFVSQINDLSGNNVHLTQSNGSYQPQTGTRTLNSLNVLDHESSGQYLSYNGWNRPASGDFSIFTVAVIDSLSTNNDSVFSIDDNSNVADFQFNSNSSTQFNGRLGVTGMGNSVNLGGVWGDGPFDGPSIYNASFDFTNGWYHARVDGNRKTNNTDYSTKLALNSDLQIFTNRDATANPNGAWAETIIIESCSEACRQLIEGYLAHKWGTEANLSVHHPFKNNPPFINDQQVDWSPEYAEYQIRGHYDALDASSITSASGKVSSWADQGDGGNDIVQTSETKKPLTGSATVSGKNAILFDGTDDELTVDSPFSSTINDIFMIYIFNAKALDQSVGFTLTGSSSDAYRWQAHTPWDSGNVIFDVGGTTVNKRIAGGSLSADTDYLVALYSSVTEQYKDIRIDGAFVNSAETVVSVNKVSKMAFGSAYLTDYDNIAYGEIVIVEDTLTAEEKVRFEGYLAWKWDFELPTVHPYRNYAPSYYISGE